jgi:hypothetical protein
MSTNVRNPPPRPRWPSRWSAGAQPKGVKVGILHPVTGALAFSGQQCREGALDGHRGHQQGGHQGAGRRQAGRAAG